MSEPIIRVENLGKKYRIQHRESGPRYRALRDVLTDGIKTTAALCRGRRPARRTQTEEFWALKDVSFDIQEGEVVGIIGRNGAGKSTLLKILSRITEPSAGRVTLNGRVASLLEVGTGFHPELTGRENIYLNGSVLGMSRSEVRGKFDEIVAFAEVEQFLDTPVKRYSSGMYVRLAFAVAAHLEPEILIVDEVLAVGDARFQNKCLTKMQDASRGGRTVIFVSHNLAAVQSLCRSGIVLDHGLLITQASAVKAVARYLERDDNSNGSSERKGLSDSLSLLSMDSSPSAVHRGQSITVSLKLRSLADEVITDLALLVHAPGGERVAIVDLRSPEGAYRLHPGSTLHIESVVRSLPFVEADFSLGLWINADSVSRTLLNLKTITVLPDDAPRGVVPREAYNRGLVELDAQVEAKVE
jgi:lipopolysaccharide transport system ATP-binding protein